MFERKFSVCALSSTVATDLARCFLATKVGDLFDPTSVIDIFETSVVESRPIKNIKRNFSLRYEYRFDQSNTLFIITRI
jgi:hypothetical protein